MSADMDIFTLAGSLILTGCVVVFLVLFLLIFIVWLMGRITASIAEKQAKKAAPVPAAPAAVQQPAAAMPAPMQVEEGIPPEEVAVIAAAVAAASQDAPVAIRSVARTPGSRSAWGAAGILRNTRPV